MPTLASAYKQVRLRALQESPGAFCSSYAKESRFPEDEWLRRAESSDGRTAIVFIGFDEAEPVGLIRCNLDQHRREHAHITAMWTAPHTRGTGLASSLLDAAQQWAKARSVRKMLLMVVSDNQRAIRFYERDGFAMTGRVEPHSANAEWQDYEMSKALL